MMRPRRQRLGQHFLRDARVARAIVEALPATPARVIEIGPGRGALTALLLQRYPEVRAIELDGPLAAALPARLGSPRGLDVRHDDAVAANLDALAGGGPWLVAGNLPYSVATPIVRRLVERPDLFPAAVVMVQLEVAQRMVAAPGDRARGLLSVLVEAQADAELLFAVPPSCFAPPPRVTSAVVRLRLRRAAVPAEHLARAFELAGEAFSHRRKQLANALQLGAAREEVSARLAGLGLGPAMRPQEVTLAGWLALAGAFPRRPGEEA